MGNKMDKPRNDLAAKTLKAWGACCAQLIVGQDMQQQQQRNNTTQTLNGIVSIIYRRVAFSVAFPCQAMIKNHKKACKRNKVKAEDQVAVLEAVRDALNTIIPRAPNVALNLAGIDDMTPEVVEAAINTVAKDKVCLCPFPRFCVLLSSFLSLGFLCSRAQIPPSPLCFPTPPLPARLDDPMISLWVTHIQNVTHVILASCNIGASLVDPLSDMCAQSMLQCINLSHNPLGPDLGAAIGTACMQSPSLKQLYLRNTDLGDDGLERFLGRMSGHATLEVVDLARNNITSAMAERLADFVVSCPNLIGIGLRHNSSLPRATWAEGEIANTLATRCVRVRLRVCACGVCVCARVYMCVCVL